MSEASGRLIEMRAFARMMAWEGPREQLPSRESRGQVEELPNELGGGPETRARGLTRISHQLSAVACDAPHPAVFSRLGVLDVPQVRAPRPSGRKPHWAHHLAALATKPSEICGLSPAGRAPSR